MLPLLVKWPTRSRPKLFAEQFPRWNAVPEAVRFLVTLDQDDKALPDYLAYLKDRENVQTFVGRSWNKVHACNRDMEHAGEFSTVILASDDMTPQRPDWAARVQELMALHWPDGDGVLHTNDGRTGRTLNTLCICGRAYYERTGYFYHGQPKHEDGYQSVFCDNEFQEVSERLSRAVYVDECIIRHDWIGSHQPDELHRWNEAAWAADEATFHRRMAWGFPSDGAKVMTPAMIP